MIEAALLLGALFPKRVSGEAASYLFTWCAGAEQYLLASLHAAAAAGEKITVTGGGM